MKNLLLTVIFFVLSLHLLSQNIQIATLKYGGGGDWYSNPTALPNLVEFFNRETGSSISSDIPNVNVGSSNLYNYPYIYMTGHGNVFFTSQEAENLRNYLMAGGFLHVDDNYGMEPYFRREIKKVFPELQLIELPFDHSVYHQKFSFPDGLPKIHEHDGEPPQGFAMFYEGRMVVFFSYESDLGNGWEDPAVHGNDEETRLKALRMGSNLLQYIFNRRDV
ncbi:MAG: DUF4159 domain-containing protein [Bacteroidota bacterium]